MCSSAVDGSTLEPCALRATLTFARSNALGLFAASKKAVHDIDQEVLVQKKKKKKNGGHHLQVTAIEWSKTLTAVL